ncbi:MULTISPECIES: O-methyltransferase [Dysgonomonas]|uniref:O-methyltransferase n=1 Tax=Dysgonomonas TaxID=156973 RepID=UPI00092B987B|nr:MULTISPECIES: O-methyltransferase [Dysgonomonas]MBN9301514.1 O-methyltransferase [Dysgonomonas mossii]MBS5978305.1 O-methyltransferase [Dysgonomonas mossii]OJX62754.1 MAG: methyltransferase [Dysgonomonas sp. 37-18]HML65914.1 O-methyltransferase [Dysgonomonas sp.]
MSLEKDEAIESYILSRIDQESELLKQLNRDAHVNLLKPRMLSGHLQGRMLKIFCRMMNPKYILEIGTYTAYATLCLAEGADNDAEIHTIEVNDELEDFILKHLHKSKLKDKIHLHIGDAMEIIPQIDRTFDLVFIDANKRHYIEYYNLIFDKVRPGGLIIADNTLWDGHVLETPKPSDKQTIGIQQFNDMIAKDDRVEKVILPIRDGLTLIWKK